MTIIHTSKQLLFLTMQSRLQIYYCCFVLVGIVFLFFFIFINHTQCVNSKTGQYNSLDENKQNKTNLFNVRRKFKEQPCPQLGLDQH